MKELLLILATLLIFTVSTTPGDGIEGCTGN